MEEIRRQSLLKYLWRSTAVFFWLWVASRRWPDIPVLSIYRPFSLWFVILVLVGTFAAYAFVRGSRKGILSEVAIYLLKISFSPFLFFGIVSLAVLSLPTLLAKYSQSWPVRLFVLSATAGLVLATIKGVGATGWLIGGAIALSSLLLVSVGAWVFQPMPMYFAIRMWSIRSWPGLARKHELPSAESLRAGAQGAEDKLRNFVKHHLTAHKKVREIVDKKETLKDGAWLETAFFWKFATTLAHLSLLFACAHFALNSRCSAGDCAYTGFKSGPFSNTWLDYAYFGFMTLLSGNGIEQPLTGAAKLLVVVNALSGVALLIILVMTFSLVSRSQLRRRVFEAVRGSEAELRWASGQVLCAAHLASTTGTMTPGLRTEMAIVVERSLLPEPDESAFKGILLCQQLHERLSGIPDQDGNTAFVQRTRQRFSLSDYGDFHRQSGGPANGFDPATLMETFRRVAVRVA